MKLTVVPMLFVAGIVLASCGGHSTKRGATLHSVITRVTGTRTVLVTITNHASTDAQPTSTEDHRSLADLIDTGYYACRDIPRSLVRAARHDIAARRRVAEVAMRMLATLGSRREQPALLEGCLRALKLPALPRTKSA
jgi:uncharacterized membrane protein